MKRDKAEIEKLISALHWVHCERKRESEEGREGYTRSSFRFRSLNFLRYWDFFHFLALRDAIEPRPWNETCYYHVWNVYFPRAKRFEQYKIFEAFEDKKISLSCCFATSCSFECFCLLLTRRRMKFIYLYNIAEKQDKFLSKLNI